MWNTWWSNVAICIEDSKHAIILKGADNSLFSLLQVLGVLDQPAFSSLFSGESQPAKNKEEGERNLNRKLLHILKWVNDLKYMEIKKQTYECHQTEWL